MQRIISIALTTLILWSMTSYIWAQERLNFVYISPNAGSSSVLWVAKDMGFFKKQGLDVNVIYIEGTPKALMALFAGELQVVAGTGPAVASAKVRGADATMIMGLEVYLPYYLVATSGIKSVEDLKGKVGANHSAATSADFAMRLGLRNIGLDPERDVNLRVVGATNLRMLAMQQGQAQFTVADGDLKVTWSGGFDGSSLRQAANAADLAGCESCYLQTDLTGYKRLQISTASAVQAGGLSLQSAVGRRVRWDLYLTE